MSRRRNCRFATPRRERSNPSTFTRDVQSLVSGSNRANEFQVAVVGFGPSGAVAASLLGAEGIRTLAVDRDRAVYDKPRAIAIDHEILRLFDNLGIAGQLRPYVAPFPASEHFGARGQLIRRIDMVSEPYPLGYTPTMVFTQPPVEEILRAHARSLPSVVVELGTELLRLGEAPDGVTLELRGDQGMRNVTADYVIACDGASSGVRRQLGIGFDDLVFDEPWLVIDLRVNDAGIAKLPRTAAQFCEPARPTTYHRRTRLASAFRDHAAAGRGSARDGAARAGLAAPGALADAR